MSTALRFSRGGTKKTPYYRLVATNSRSPRDSKFIEKLGIYNPLLAKTDAKRVSVNEERVKYWLGVGAQPSETVARFLRNLGLYTGETTFVSKPKGSNLKKKAADALAATNKAAEDAKAAPAVDAPAAPAAAEVAPAAEAAPEAPAA